MNVLGILKLRSRIFEGFRGILENSKVGLFYPRPRLVLEHMIKATLVLVLETTRYLNLKSNLITLLMETLMGKNLLDRAKKIV